MPKAPLNPAADKLPLAVRKNFRDEWENKKPEYEKTLSTLFGETWTFTTNPNLIYANVSDESYKQRIGSVLSWYIEPFLQNMKRFVDNFGEDGKAELNSTATKHVVDFGPEDTTDFRYGGLVIEDGVLRLVYKAPDSFAVNVDGISNDLSGTLKAANAASGKAYNIVARNSVKDNYDGKIDDHQEKIGKLVGVKDIKLSPNFEKNAEMLAKCKETRDDWDNIIGQSTLDYFKAFERCLQKSGFENDDMLQEGFQEGVPKNEIVLRVVDKIKGSYNEVVMEDGVLYMQTTADKWWVNVDDIGSNILDLL